jgi:hypothetical protein
VSTEQAPRCAGCRHFSGTAQQVEALLPGLRTLSSAYGAVRSQDGLCGVHARYVAAYSYCKAHEARSVPNS